MKNENSVYTHGHHESVLRSHKWRTVENSASFLLPYLKDGVQLLDAGCGPGNITAGLAALIPNGKAVGIDFSAEIISQARMSTQVKNLRILNSNKEISTSSNLRMKLLI